MPLIKVQNFRPLVFAIRLRLVAFSHAWLYCIYLSPSIYRSAQRDHILPLYVTLSSWSVSNLKLGFERSPTWKNTVSIQSVYIAVNIYLDNESGRRDKIWSSMQISHVPATIKTRPQSPVLAATRPKSCCTVESWIRKFESVEKEGKKWK